MKKILIPVFLTCLIIGFSACSDDDENCGTVAVESLENLYGCVNTSNNMEFTFNSAFEIIRTQGRFDSLILGNCKPVIDFSTYDLVVGEENLTSGVDVINYEYTPLCNNTDGVLKVTFISNPTAVAPTLTYHALIPKLASSETVTVDVQVD
jgi:hypothetical protein